MFSIKSLPHRLGGWSLKTKLMLGFGLVIILVVLLSGFALNGFDRVINAFHQNDQVSGLNRQALESRIEQRRFDAEDNIQALNKARNLLTQMTEIPITGTNEHRIAPLLTDYVNSLNRLGATAAQQRQARKSIESASNTVNSSMATLTEVIRNELALRISLYNDSELTSLFEQYQASAMLDRSLTHNHLRWLRFVESGTSAAKPLLADLDELRDQADKLEALGAELYQGASRFVLR